MYLHFFNFLFLAFNRFFDMVNSITEEIGKTTEEGECDGDSLEVYSVFFVVFLNLFSTHQLLWVSTVEFH